MKLIRVTVGVIYFRPDFRSILQELYWSTDDRDPDLPRVRSFLDFWRREVDAVIKEVILSKSVPGASSWRRVDQEFFH